MIQWLLAVETVCADPSREEEFNRWYDNTHLPDVLETSGILRGTRYENISTPEGRGKYLALYEVETDDIERLMSDLWEVITRKGEEGRWSDLVDIVAISSYRKITHTIEST